MKKSPASLASSYNSSFILLLFLMSTSFISCTQKKGNYWWVESELEPTNNFVVTVNDKVVSGVASPLNFNFSNCGLTGLSMDKAELIATNGLTTITNHNGGNALLHNGGCFGLRSYSSNIIKIFCDLDTVIVSTPNDLHADEKSYDDIYVINKSSKDLAYYNRTKNIIFHCTSTSCTEIPLPSNIRIGSSTILNLKESIYYGNGYGSSSNKIYRYDKATNQISASTTRNPDYINFHTDFLEGYILVSFRNRIEMYDSNMEFIAEGEFLGLPAIQGFKVINDGLGHKLAFTTKRSVVLYDFSTKMFSEIKIDGQNLTDVHFIDSQTIWYGIYQVNTYEEQEKDINVGLFKSTAIIQQDISGEWKYGVVKQDSGICFFGSSAKDNLIILSREGILDEITCVAIPDRQNPPKK